MHSCLACGVFYHSSNITLSSLQVSGHVYVQGTEIKLQMQTSLITLVEGRTTTSFNENSLCLQYEGKVKSESESVKLYLISSLLISSVC